MYRSDSSSALPSLSGSHAPPGSSGPHKAPADFAHRLVLEHIAEAARDIDPVFLRSPQLGCEPLGAPGQCDLTLKVETLNPIRSFKGRGADYFMQRHFARGESGPLVCASAGNFGQALAYVCRKYGVPLVVFAARNANELKVARMRALGAEVRLEGHDFDAAKEAARAWSTRTGTAMVEDGLAPEIAEGAGSIAVELLDRGNAFDAVLIPLGNGALLTGMARWIKAVAPATQVIGVCSERADAMRRSWLKGPGAAVEAGASAATIADGIAVRVPIPQAVADMHGLVDAVVTVSDDAILRAMRHLHAMAGLVVEPAGAAGVAAIGDHFAGQRIATVLCGGNVTDMQMREWLLAPPRVDS